MFKFCFTRNFSGSIFNNFLDLHKVLIISCRVQEISLFLFFGFIFLIFEKLTFAVLASLMVFAISAAFSDIVLIADKAANISSNPPTFGKEIILLAGSLTCFLFTCYRSLFNSRYKCFWFFRLYCS